MDIGKKIKRLRMRHGLTQQELADRTELSKGYISQLESDLTSPSIATLMDLLETLGTNLCEFFGDEDDEQTVFKKEDAFEKVDKNLGMSVLWLVTSAQKNTMEPIMLTLSPNGRTEEDDPHSGEEYGYVLTGSVILHLGGERLRVKKGDSFYFSSGKPHYIENNGKTEARVLWIASPPTF